MYRNGVNIECGVFLFFLLFTFKFCVYCHMMMDLKFDSILEGNVFLTIYGEKFRKCQENCAIRRRCKSINYRRLSMTCQLNSLAASSGSTLNEEFGWVYQDRSEWDTEAVCGTCTDSQVCNTGTSICETRECEVIQESGAFRVFGNMNLVNSRKVLACPDDKYPVSPGTFMSWPVQSHCQSNGTWSTAYLNCTDYTTVCHKYLSIATTIPWLRYKSEDVLLVSGSCAVEDNMLSASSIHDENLSFQPSNAKFDKGEAWVGKKLSVNPDPYIQVQLHDVLEIKSIQTKGRGSDGQWVKTFNVTYSTSNCSQTVLEQRASDSKGSYIFIGNVDQSTMVENNFQTPINARCVRVHPLELQNTFEDPYPAMQFDLVGTVKLPVF